MGFRDATASRAPAGATRPAPRAVAPSRRVPGGRYAGIRMASGGGPPPIKQGDYIVEIVRTGASRKGQTLMITAKVIDNNDDVTATKNGDTGIFMVNIGGDAYDIGLGTVKRLVGIVAGVDTDDELEALSNAGELVGTDGEPGDWGELIDATFGEAQGTAVFGANPLGGNQVIAVVRDSTSLDEKGQPYRNVSFERIEEAAPF